MFAQDFTDALLRWGNDVRRDLPWRLTRDPWAVLVSELMLQQTQVSRVVPKYEAFLEAYPTPSACADAPRGDIIAAWAGLGYNRRAVNLHRSAIEMRDRWAGEVPAELDDLFALPGIGPYTARAVMVFAYKADIGVVDVNVGRLLARWSGAALTVREAQELADSLVPEGDAWRWGQTLFDLGASLCGAKRVGCAQCPVAKWCAWKGVGPDPAIGSAATTSKQSRFAGSDRQGRGRLVDALRVASVEAKDFSTVMGWDDVERCERVAATLLADGLAVRVGDRFELPR